ncbi:hypothetical protein Tco_1529415, partial [Tanacetum coccineum]
MQEGMVPSFLPTDDPLERVNKALAFLRSTIISRYPQTNNQIRTLFNSRHQAIIQEGKVDMGKAMDTQESQFDMGKALDVDSVVIESSGTESKKHDTSSRSGNDTHAKDVDITLVNDKEPVTFRIF